MPYPLPPQMDSKQTSSSNAFSTEIQQSLISAVKPNPTQLNKQDPTSSQGKSALFPLLYPKQDQDTSSRLWDGNTNGLFGGESFEEVPGGRLFTGLADGRIVELIRKPKEVGDNGGGRDNWTSANIARTGNWLFSHASSPTSSPHPSYVFGEVQTYHHRHRPFARSSSFPKPPLFPHLWPPASSLHSLLPHHLEASCGDPQMEWACGRPLGLKWHKALAVLVTCDASYGLIAVKVDEEDEGREWKGVCSGNCRNCVGSTEFRDCVGVCIGCVGGMKKGEVRLLTNMAAGRKIYFANGLDILQNYFASPPSSHLSSSPSYPPASSPSCLSALKELDGDIFFSDSSSRYRRNRVFLESYEAGPGGRLLRYRPRTATTEVVLDRLAFPNGVLFMKHRWPPTLLVVELMRFRILQYPLMSEEIDDEETETGHGGIEDRGEGQTSRQIHCYGNGNVTVFVEDLPFFPDNITYARSTALARASYFVASSFERKGLWKLVTSSGRISWLCRLLMALVPYELVTRIADKLKLAGGLLAEIQEVEEGGEAKAETELPLEEGGWGRKAVIGTIRTVFRYGNNVVDAERDEVDIWSRGLMHLSEGFLTSAGHLLLGSFMPSQPLWVMENFESFREMQGEDATVEDKWRNTNTRSQDKRAEGERPRKKATKTSDEL
eukprot:GHVS01094302.1.p1 GENE.GHVS01094302.1~~GHVS01094302.1.p1  ORF type:complete len:697 (+),score=134.14 GHVS01094302.1:101-2092(+)